MQKQKPEKAGLKTGHYSRGYKPRSRAMIMRWISLVPS